MRTQRYAALDCGTNSLRLLIAEHDPQQSGLLELHRDMRIVRLGEGVDETGEFSAGALQRTFEATELYAQKINELGVPQSNIRFVATSASRDVSNRDEFLDGISARLGVVPQIISGDEEAALSFAGAAGALGLPVGTEVLVVDLGGGSTEFVLGTIGPTGPTGSHPISTDMGCVRLTDRLLHSDPPTEEEKAATVAVIEEKITEAAQEIDFSRVEAVVGVAGTITTITAEVLNLSDYSSAAIHGAECTLEELMAGCNSLIDAKREMRAQRGFMHPGRVDVIGAGALIYRTVLEYLRSVSHVRTAFASEQDILDGTLLSQLPAGS